MNRLTQVLNIHILCDSCISVFIFFIVSIPQKFSFGGKYIHICLQANCTITVHAFSELGLKINTTYRVALMVEDFPHGLIDVEGKNVTRIRPLSKIPMQVLTKEYKIIKIIVIKKEKEKGSGIQLNKHDKINIKCRLLCISYKSKWIRNKLVKIS